MEILQYSCLYGCDFFRARLLLDADPKCGILGSSGGVESDPVLDLPVATANQD